MDLSRRGIMRAMGMLVGHGTTSNLAAAAQPLEGILGTGFIGEAVMYDGGPIPSAEQSKELKSLYEFSFKSKRMLEAYKDSVRRDRRHNPFNALILDHDLQACKSFSNATKHRIQIEREVERAVELIKVRKKNIRIRAFMKRLGYEWYW